MGGVDLGGKRILVTGGTGSLGQVVVKRLLSGEVGRPAKVIVFSRDEARQSAMRLRCLEEGGAEPALEFRLGDVRRFRSLAAAVRDVEVVIHAAAMKQVPSCEYSPYEAVLTNVTGAENIVRAIELYDTPVETVVAISTDKACLPVSVMGMTKALQERIFITGNLQCRSTRFLGVRYGNFLASRGSVVPRFHDQIRRGGPVTVTSRGMTRFLMSLDEAVDAVFAAMSNGHPGMIYVPKLPAARMIDVARALVGDRPIEVAITESRPGEKEHEVLLNDAEARRTVLIGDRWYGVLPMLPELAGGLEPAGCLDRAYSSKDALLDPEATRALLEAHGLMLD